MPEIEERPRKANPSDRLRQIVASAAAMAEEQGDAEAELVILKSRFLSAEKPDVEARQRRAASHKAHQAAGDVQVSFYLTPTEQGALDGMFGKHGAPAVRQCISRALNGQATQRVNPADLEADADEAAPEIVGKPVKGATLELFSMSDGSVDGRVTAGALRGGRLSALGFGYLSIYYRELFDAAQANEELEPDPDGFRWSFDLELLTRYLDARFEDWREAMGGAEEAAAAVSAAPYRELGIEPGASYEEARAAFREAVRTLHPDQNGGKASPWMQNALRRVLDAWEEIKGQHAEAKMRERDEEEARRKAEAKAAREAKRATQ